MNRIYPKVLDRKERFLTAWRELAAEESFAEMTLEQFETATAKPDELRQRIAATKATLSGLNQQRQQADDELSEKLGHVVNAVRGNPRFGEKSPLYRAFGYVPKDRRNSGLTRKGAKATVDANVA